MIGLMVGYITAVQWDGVYYIYRVTTQIEISERHPTLPIDLH